MTRDAMLAIISQTEPEGYSEYNGEIITTLLQPFTADPTIAVIPFDQATSKRQLCSALLAATDSTPPHIPANKIIIPVSYNDHFYGLYLTRNPLGDYTATYIDPEGQYPGERDIPLMQAITPFIEGGIKYSSARLQYENKHSGAFTSFILTELAAGRMTLAADGKDPNGVTLQGDEREMPNVSESDAGREASARLGVSIRALHARLISGRSADLEPLRAAIVESIDRSIEPAAKARPTLDPSLHSAARDPSAARSGSGEPDSAPRDSTLSALSATARVVGGDKPVSYSIDPNGKIEFHLHKDRVEGMVTGGGKGMGSHTTTYASILEAACFSCIASDPMDIPRRIQAIGSLFPGYATGDVDTAVERLTRSEEAKQELLGVWKDDVERSQIIKRGAAVVVAEYITERAQALLVAINTSKNIAFAGSGALGKSQGGIVGAEIPKIALLRTFLDLKDEVAKHENPTTVGGEKIKSAARIARLVERLNPAENRGYLATLGIECDKAVEAVDKAKEMLTSFEGRWNGGKGASVANLMLPILANTFDYTQDRHGRTKGDDKDEMKAVLSEICMTHLALVSLACGLDKLNPAQREQIATEFLTQAVLTETVERRTGGVKITQGWRAQPGLTSEKERGEFVKSVIEDYERKMSEVRGLIRGAHGAAAPAPAASAAPPAASPAPSPSRPHAVQARRGADPASPGGRGAPTG